MAGGHPDPVLVVPGQGRRPGGTRDRIPGQVLAPGGAGAGVPEPQGPARIGGGRQQPAPTGSHRGGKEGLMHDGTAGALGAGAGLAVRRHRQEALLTPGQVPDPGGAIVAGTGQGEAVGGKGDAPHPVAMAPILTCTRTRTRTRTRARTRARTRTLTRTRTRTLTRSFPAKPPEAARRRAWLSPRVAPDLDSAIMGPGREEGHRRLPRRRGIWSGFRHGCQRGCRSGCPRGCRSRSRHLGHGQVGDLIGVGKEIGVALGGADGPEPGRTVLPGPGQDASLVLAEAGLRHIPLMADDAQSLTGPEAPEADRVVQGGRENDGLLEARIAAGRDLQPLHGQVVVAEDVGLSGGQIPAHYLAIVVHRHQGLAVGAEGRLADRGAVDADLMTVTLDGPQLGQLTALQVIDPDAIIPPGHADPLAVRGEGRMVGGAAKGPGGGKAEFFLAAEGSENLGGAVIGSGHQPVPVGVEAEGAHPSLVDDAVPEGLSWEPQVQDAEGAGPRLPMEQGQIASLPVHGAGALGTRAAGPVRRLPCRGGQPPDAGLADPQDERLVALTDDPDRVDRQVGPEQDLVPLIALAAQGPEFPAARGRGRHQPLAVIAKGGPRGVPRRRHLGLHQGDQLVLDQGPPQGVAGLPG